MMRRYDAGKTKSMADSLSANFLDGWVRVFSEFPDR